MHTITIDCGASFIKGAIFEDGAIKRIVSRGAPFVGNEREIFSVRHIPRLAGMVREMILELAAGEREVVLCISNEMHGFLLADADGQPYTDYISWQFELERTVGEEDASCRALQEDPSLSGDILRSGMPLRASLPSSNLHCLARSGKLSGREGCLRFYTLGTYLLRNLSGGPEPEEHETNAAATGLFDLVSGDWNRKYLAAIGAGGVVMPTVGHGAVSFDLDGVEVHALPAIGDQQAALLGAGFTKADDLSFNLGTGAQVSRLTDSLVFSDVHQTRPYFNGLYLKTIPHIPSGRAFNVFFRFVKSVLEQYGTELSDDAIWDGMLRAAGSSKVNTLPQIDLNFFPNAVNGGPPLGGSITGIGEYAFSLGSLTRAVMEQMADNFATVADRLTPDRSEVKRLVFSGGIARRLDMVRERVAGHYPGAEIMTSSDETMLGLYKYSGLGEY